MAIESKNKLEVIKQMVDFQVNSIFQVANLTEKGLTAYLAIFAALTAYFITQDISIEIKKVAIVIGVIVSILASIVGSFLIWGIQKGLKGIEIGLKELDEDLYLKLKVNDFIKRGSITLFFGFLGCLTLVIVFSIGLISILK